MKKLYILFFILNLFSNFANAQQKDTLTNEKMIKLFKAGFSKDILKSKIETSITNFDTSMDGMLFLKKAGLPEDLITLMITKETKGDAKNTIASSEQSNIEMPAVDLESGIYYKNSADEFIEIEPSVLTNTKTDRGAQVFLSILINAKTKSSLGDKESSSMIYETAPAFYFIFDSTYKSNLNSENNTWFGGTRSPKEFLLVKLDVVKNSREITIGKGNAVNSDFGIEEKSLVHFTTKKLSKGVYKVTPESTLPEGEYCFMFAQGIKGGSSSKVFDFSIRAAKSF